MRHLKNVMKSNKKRQIIATFIDIATSDTYIPYMYHSKNKSTVILWIRNFLVSLSTEMIAVTLRHIVEGLTTNR